MQTQGCRCILLSRQPELKKRYHFFTLDYFNLGKSAVEFAVRRNFKRFFFINHAYFNWHMQNLERGLISAADQAGVSCEILYDYLLQDAFAETWDWEEQNLFQLEPETLYIVENVENRASHIYNRLRQKKINSSMVLTFCRRKSDIDKRIPCFYMNDESRFNQISDKLLNTAIWTKTGVETKFEPELLLPD